MKPRVLRGAAPIAVFAALALAMAASLGGSGSARAAAEDCATVPPAPALQLLYRVEAGTEAVSPEAMERSISMLCARLRAFTIGDVSIEPLGMGSLRVTVPGGTSAPSDRALELIAASGQLHFYDWEPNLIGRERALGINPGFVLPRWALRAARREWTAAGRDVNDWENGALIAEGAMPNLYGAARLASQRHPRKRCGVCATSTSRFYLFGPAPRHRLLAGPVDSRSALGADAEARKGGVVLRVPLGTAIVSEVPTNRIGAVDFGADPGWFAVRDRPALDGSEVTEVDAVSDDLGTPAVTFGFTPSGATAFRRVTRAIARRGRAHAPDWVDALGASAAARLSGHLAVVMDGVVESRPIINFLEFPNGIDPRVGAQISGGFRSLGEARMLATILGLGPLPLKLMPAGRHQLNS